MLSTKEIRKTVSNLMRAAVNHFGNHVSEEILSSWDKKSKELIKMVKMGRYMNRKGRMSTYILFCNRIRPEINEQNPIMKPREIMLLMGQRWNDFKISTDPKDLELMEELNEEAKTIKENYLEEKNKEVVRPKKPPQINSAYRLFSMEQKGHSLKTINLRWQENKKDPAKHQQYLDKFKQYREAQEVY